MTAVSKRKETSARRVGRSVSVILRLYMCQYMLFKYINHIVKPRSTSGAALCPQYGPNPSMHVLREMGRIKGL